jgi:hypothetical protein
MYSAQTLEHDGILGLRTEKDAAYLHLSNIYHKIIHQPECLTPVECAEFAALHTAISESYPCWLLEEPFIASDDTAFINAGIPYACRHTDNELIKHNGMELIDALGMMITQFRTDPTAYKRSELITLMHKIFISVF